jgi:amino acid adenylation domain-containing protein
MFTSGSTGTPKGVPIPQSNAEAYVDHLVSCFQFTATDVFSQTFDLSFDLSVHDLFVCWRAGGCLAVVPEVSLLSPAKWARTNGVTVWFSVPSMAMVMADLGTLKPDALANLRISFFCGEALPASVVERWRAAAPHSAIVNLYGPTEATIAIASYAWNPATSPAHCRNGVVPIGAIFPTQRGRVADETGRALAKEHEGELWLAGSQVAAGYLDAPERTRERFVAGTAQDGVSQWYRTGDRVVEDADGVLHYLGRFDDQIKIRGHRFELLEIEHVLRRAAGAASVACVGWPSREGHAEGVVGFVAAPGGDVAAILTQCRAELPDYAVPKRLVFIGELPLNANGKVSRAGLIARLNREHEA